MSVHSKVLLDTTTTTNSNNKNRQKAKRYCMRSQRSRNAQDPNTEKVQKNAIY